MNPREKVLLSLIGGVVGLFAIYKGVDFLFVAPLKRATEEVARLEAENNVLSGVIRSRVDLARRWRDLAGRTLSFDKPEVINIFGRDLKEIAKRHGFGASYSPTAGGKIGGRTNIGAVAYRVVEEGKFTDMLGFIKDLYRTPYLCQITRLSISPIMDRSRPRGEVKFDMIVETPILPRVDSKKIPEAAAATTMPADAAERMGPARGKAHFAEEFALLAERNIFRAYVPPPTNMVLIDNTDWKAVGVWVTWHWDGKARPVVTDMVPERSQKTFTGQGDVAEVAGAYADGTSFGPVKFNFNEKKDWRYEVPLHSPAPPPVVVDLAVQNSDKNPVDVEVSLVLKDGQVKTRPLMRIPPGAQVEIDQYEAQSVNVVATYASGRKATSQLFKPDSVRQIYQVPPEPIGPAAAPVDDPPADATLMVTGLVTYPGVQEMIASGPVPNQRKVIRAGEEAAVDGGRLLAVHPLGGVVKMPTGNYYLYPLGRKFTERVKLDARQDEELAAAIDSCTSHQGGT